MTPRQIGALAICVFLYAVDGFDVLSISFASPGIAKEWGIDRAALGIVLSMELIGMAIGSLTIGALADRFGRRPVILACVSVMALGMVSVPLATGVISLSTIRLITGIGIGGMLSATGAMVAECSSDKYRSLATVVAAAGYPVGGIIGGALASHLLAVGDWRHVFLLGAALTALFLPLVWAFLPESPSYLAQKRPVNALDKINHSLKKLGHSAVTALPTINVAEAKISAKDLFSPALIATTILVTLAFASNMASFYFSLKWIPKVVVDLGFEPSQAGSVLVWYNIGGLIGSILLAIATRRFELRNLMLVALVVSAGMISLFGQIGPDLDHLKMAAAAGGFFTNAAMSGFFGLAAQSFPTAVRASGAGVVIGVGRGGAVIGPVLAGFLFAGGLPLSSVCIVMACGSILSLICLLILRGAENKAPASRAAE